MIDWYYLQVLFVALAWIWGFHYLFQDGEILGKPGNWMRKHLPEWLCTPLFDCRFCMASIHGSMVFCVFLWSYPWWMWPLFCVCLTGLTAMIYKLNSD